MELNAASVRLPRDLDASSTARLAADLRAALDGDAQVIRLEGWSTDEYCLGLAIGASADQTGATHAFAALLTELHRADKPLLAVVEGRAIGGGMGLACACDWVLASDEATFGLPELLWGLVPAIIWPVIADRMAPHVARQWTLAAHTRTAAEGLTAGLVDELVPVEQVARAITRRERSLARLAPQALRHFRAWRRASQHHDLPTALAHGADLTAGMLQTPVVRARWQAFHDGGTPWSA
jgi:enoyl-CoA hydratase/carnithine racemase